MLLWNHYVIPAWHLRADRILYWNKFSRPKITPLHGTSIDYWWFDAAKAAALKVENGSGNGETPGFGWALAALAGLALAGWAVLRRAVRRKGGAS